MSDTLPHHQIVEELLNTAVELRAATLNLSEDQLLHRQGDENWSIKEIVAHLRDADEIGCWRIEQVIETDDPPLPAFDQDNYARERNYQELPWETLIDEIAAHRQAIAKILVELDDDAWQRKGNHEKRGPVTIYDLVVTVVEHGHEHLTEFKNLGLNLG